METNVNALIEQVNSSLGCLFTKEDVVSLLQNVKVTKMKSESGIDKDFLNKIVDSLKRLHREMNDSSNLEWSNPEFELRYGNVIELDSIDIDLCNYQADLDSIIEDIEEKIENIDSVKAILVEFEHEGNNVSFLFEPTDDDEWKCDGKYDYHYCLDYNHICVYDNTQKDDIGFGYLLVHKQNIK
jgi:hypothetical protein